LVPVLIAGVFGSTLLAMSPASAAVSAGASMSVPDGASVGATNLAASITVTNNNTAPNQAEGNTITDIRFAPSCGAMGTVANPCPTPDPGAFSVSPTATGAAGTACAGRTFTVSGPDATGAFTFTASGSPVVLAPPGGATGANACTINFTMNVAKVPQIDVSSTSPGVQTWVNLRVKVTSSSGLMPVVVVARMVTVGKGVLGLATQASPSVAVGGTVADTATLSRTAGAAAPTGTVAFSVFGPDNSTCSGTPVGQSTNPVAGTGSAMSASFPVMLPGVYRFVAVYSGDANYVTRSSPCGAAGESVTVTGRLGHAVADFNGDGRTDLSFYRASSGLWVVQGMPTVNFGVSTDIPVPADYNGDGRTDIAVFRPSTGQWFVRDQFSATLGTSGDIPVPGDYNGDGRAEIAVFRPSTGQWFVQDMPVVTFGASGDIPVPGDYNGDGRTDIAFYRPSSGLWVVQGMPTVNFGVSTDVPVPGDYNGDGRTDIAVFRPSTGQWFVRDIATVTFGASGDIPVPGDYSGDGVTDIAVYRPSTGHWLVRGISDTAFGNSTDTPLPLPYAILRSLSML